MATDLGKLVYTLTLNDEGFSSKLNESASKVKNSGDSMSGSMKKAEESSKGLSGQFGGMAGQFVAGAAIFTLGQKALDGVTGVIHDGIQAAKEWQTQQAGLNQVLKSTGDASGLTADEVKKLAQATEDKTAIDKAAVLTGDNMLLTFTNIGKNVFPMASDAMTDMATRMNGGAIPTGEQLSQTAIQLGKALNDPTTGLSALHKVGVTFTDQQKEQIKTMQAAGDMAGAQKVILAELGKEFGGQAAANLNTFTGQIAVWKDTMGDIVEKIIGDLIPVLKSLGDFLLSHKVILAAVGGAVAGLAIAIGVALVAALWAVVAPAVAAALALWPIIAVGAAIGAAAFLIISNWDKIRPALQPLFDFFTNNILPIIKEIASFVGGQLKAAWNDLKKAFDQVITTLRPFEPQLKILAIILGVVLMAPIIATIAVIGILIAVVVGVITVVARLIGWFAEAAAAVLRFEARVIGAVARVFSSVASYIGGVIGFFASLPGRIMGALAGAGSWLVNIGGDIINGLIRGITNGIGHAVDAVKNAGKSIINAAKGVLKIFSPSHVFDEEIGQQITAGLAKGITNTSDKAINAASNMAGAVVNAGTPTIPMVNGGANNSVSNGATYNIDRVELSTGDAVKEFFSMGNRNGQLERNGIAPLAGTVSV